MSWWEKAVRMRLTIYPLPPPLSATIHRAYIQSELLWTYLQHTVEENYLIL